MPAPAPRTPLSTVLRHELRQTADSLRFRVSAGLLLTLLAFAAVSGGARYGSAVVERRALLAEQARRWTGATVDSVAEVLQPAIRPPSRLSFVVDGNQTATPDLFRQALSALVAPEIGRLSRGNTRLPESRPLDWMFVFRAVLPLVAFLLGYDQVCGECRAGLLKLVLSYPVARWQVFAGKLLALWICLAAPLVAGAAASVALAATVGGIPLSGPDLGRALLVLGLGLWAALFYAQAALLVSTLSRSASTSLSVLLWLWVAAVIVAPAVGGFVASRLRPLPGAEEIRTSLADVDRELAREYAGREGRWRQPLWAAADGFAWERVSAEAENRRAALRGQIFRTTLERKVHQARLAHQLAALSPTSLLEIAGEHLAGTGLARDESFLDQAQSYRDELAHRLRDLDARDPASPHVLFFSGYLSERPLPSPPQEALPPFAFRELASGPNLRRAGPPLALLALETLALALAAFHSFSRHAAE